MKDLSMKVSLLCPICGNDQFESLDVDQEDLVNADPQVRIKCSDCYNVFSKEELLKENVEIIDIAVEEVRQASAMEFEKDLKKALKKLKL